MKGENGFSESSSSADDRAGQGSSLARLLGGLIDSSGETVAYESEEFADWLECEIAGRLTDVERRESERAAAIISRSRWRVTSMTPWLRGGDVILVSARKPVTLDCIVVARRADDGYVVKHVTRRDRTKLELSSFNKEYAPFDIERTPGAIIGVVVARLVRDEGVTGS